jgi:type I restriction enzyme S subunit
MALHPRYTDELLRTEVYRVEYVRRSTGVNSSRLRLYPEQFLRIPIIAPPPDEQAAIIRFLDHADGRINRYIRAKKKLIALLNEQKQAVIHRALTRGLDPNVKLKPSGVQSLGDLPDHWEIIQLSAASSLIQTGPFGSQLSASWYVAGGVPIINPSHLIDGKVIPEQTVTISEEAAMRLRRHWFESGDIALARRGELGRCAVISEMQAGWICGTGTIKLRVKPNKLNPKYCALLFDDPRLRSDLKLMSIGATMDNLNEGMIGRLVIALPPLDEQVAILEFVEKYRKGIDALIVEGKRAIELLREYRTRLTADVVTGKLDVRQAAAKLPDIGAEPTVVDESEELLEDDLTAEEFATEAVDEAA